MKKISLGFSCLFLSACAGFQSNTSSEPRSPAAAKAAKPVSLVLTVADSKEVYVTHPKDFKFSFGEESLDCNPSGFYVQSSKELSDGWDAARAADYTGAPAGRNHSYTFSACRDNKMEAFAWLSNQSDELQIEEMLATERFDIKKNPIFVETHDFATDERQQFECKELTTEAAGENKNYKFTSARINCQPATLSKKQTGVIDFAKDPGPYTGSLSYKFGSIPTVAPGKKSFERVSSALFKRIPEGTYTGVMSTLSKTCEVSIAKNVNEITITHTMTATAKPMVRRVVLTPENLYGFAEGDIFVSIDGYDGEVVGAMTAVYFKDAQKGFINLRFDENSGKDAQVVRINGGETYCRRLVRK